MSTKQVEVTGMAHGGDALARHEGKVIFVPYALPGEEILVELTEERAKYARANLVEVVAASPERVEPRCPHFGTCGGCHWQHIAYETQLSLREETLRSQLRRIGHLAGVSIEPSLSMSNPWYYRNRVQLHLDSAGHLGFMAAKGRRVVPIRECHIMHQLVADVFADLEIDFPDLEMVSIRAGTTTGQQLLILETVGKSAPALDVDTPVSCVLLLEDGTPVTYLGDNYITENLAGRSFRISSTSFFQANTAQAERVLETVHLYLAPEEDQVLLDVYCGVGTFGLSLADKVREVIGIEQSKEAIADARFNSEEMANIRFLEGRAEELLPELDEKIDLVIVDPPRQGCRKRALTALLKLQPQKIVYVSCDPATLARDIGWLVQDRYELAEIQPVDMFPQTFHVETVALLHLSSS
jgi:23S rRNA (uracil1939-C5)-methyltransferase